MSRFGQEARTALMVWRRELIRFRRNPARIVTSFVQPVLYLFVLGYGLGQFVQSGGGPDYKQYLFPGSVAMNIITTSIFSGVSIVWDREFGFLREMLVAPVSRSSIILGKVLGGAVTATMQGCLMLVLAPVIHVKLTVLSVLGFVAGSFLMAFSLTSFGVLVASRMKKMEGFQVVMQFLLFPMIFLSGVMFPVRGLPGWLTVLTRVNPLTYAVDPLRRIMLGKTGGTLASGVTLFGAVLPVWSEFAIMAGLALLFLGFAIRAFSKTE
jgi:ABC-2 type transport system permease protein